MTSDVSYRVKTRERDEEGVQRSAVTGENVAGTDMNPF
jgi:hypothetical protein